MIDVSRIMGPGGISATLLPHSHHIGERRAVASRGPCPRNRPGCMAENSTARSPDALRALQADPAVGGARLISADTPTSIDFFLEVHPDQ
jgi:hypothetical protein